jgi:outer membrane protein, multidrug efflux system
MEIRGRCQVRSDELRLVRVRMTKPFSWGGLLLMALLGCSVGPNYHSLKMEVPKQWIELPASGVSSGTATAQVSSWWTTFGDSQLNSLIDRAVQSNTDLRIAAARIREARALRGVAAADAFPTVDASGKYSRSRSSENQPGGGTGTDTDWFIMGFDASWEIDVFGGMRRKVEAADADIAVAEEKRRDVLITLLSDVAQNYLELRGNQLRIAITRENIVAQRKTVELTEGRYGVGLSNELEVAQARAQLAATESQIPTLETAVKRDIHRLGVLLGQQPGILLEELSVEAPIPPTPPDVPAGLPSDLLRRRPDIRRVERELAATTARIGVATAELFPKFFLTGVIGQESVSMSDFASPASRFWSVGPTISWRLLDGGRIRANIKAQDARQEQALGLYEKTVLIALEDVENALVAYSKEKETRRALSDSVEANTRAVNIANELYSKGLTDFLNVLVSQRSLFQSQDALAQSNQKVSSNLVALYKALGGGWDIATPNGEAVQ